MNGAFDFDLPPTTSREKGSAATTRVMTTRKESDLNEILDPM